MLLCRVMLTLKPNSVPKIHEDKAEFRRRENLFFFLEALDENDFPAKKKFAVADLYEEKNLVKVLYVSRTGERKKERDKKRDCLIII